MDIEALLAGVRLRQVESPDPARCLWHSPGGDGETQGRDAHEGLPDGGNPHYANRDPAHGIDFRVQRLPLEGLQVMDPRLVHIAPGACNERHRHAHESIFVVLTGRGEIRIGAESVPLAPGDVACVPRWVVHQSRNTSASEALLLLAITDFGFTSAVLGDYDARTRLKSGGADAFAPTGSGGPEAP